MEITPTKIDRNLELTALRKQDSKTWTFMRLAKNFDISAMRAYDIYNANKHKIK